MALKKNRNPHLLYKIVAVPAPQGGMSDDTREHLTRELAEEFADTIARFNAEIRILARGGNPVWIPKAKVIDP